MQKNRFKLFSLITLVFFQTLNSQNLKEDPNLQAAYQAQSALNLEVAKKLFDSVSYNIYATKKNRCDALRSSAVIYWKHYKDYKKAKEHLLIADSIGDYRSETWLTYLRVEAEAGHYSKALLAGEKAMYLSVSKADKNYARYQYSKVILEQSIIQVEKDQPVDLELLNSAAILLEDVLKTNPTNVNAADILLGISLLQNDPAKAMIAWLAYYRFSTAESAYAYLEPTAKQLEQLFKLWETRALKPEEQIALVEALGASRFHNYAKILVKRFNLKESKALLYDAYTKDIEKITNEYYRLASIGEADFGIFINSFDSKNEALYALLTDASAAAYSLDNFRDLIRPQFGAFLLISSSSASSQRGLVFGHIVNERMRMVEQYGHNADFAFTELDMMVSNGYPSWFWENGGAGGYALRGGFLRIKPLFNFLAINAWENSTDVVKRSKIEKEINDNLFVSNLDTDIKVIRALLSKKINLDALDALYNRLVNEGLKGLELQLKFIEQYELYRDNATMFAHEGRHSIDRVVLGQENYRALGSKVIEYRGRLSQIAFSKSPKIELANMLSSVSSTPTGQSNKMILDVFNNWIKTHSNEIKGYNINQLPLANLYKLTDTQIISCIQNVDPFFIEYQKQKN